MVYTIKCNEAKKKWNLAVFDKISGIWGDQTKWNKNKVSLIQNAFNHMKNTAKQTKYIQSNNHSLEFQQPNKLWLL